MIQAIIVVVLVGTFVAAPAADEVPALDGFYDFSGEFKMYSGYLPLQAEPQIRTHYVFITSKNNPETDDLVLWSNGGPGCSSLIGFLSELGPHLIKAGNRNELTNSKNPYSWNNNANILFLESPPGVGFSINKDSSYKANDQRSAQDNLHAIKEWFKLFPEYGKHKFWISGESYCGMYLPFLAEQLLKHQEDIVPDGHLDFQGMLIGNGVMWTPTHWRRQARNAFYSRHYFYGPQIQSLLAKCKYDQSDDKNPECLMGNKLADAAVRRINPYNSIGICYNINSKNGKASRKFWYSAFDEQMYNQVEADNEPSCSSDDAGMDNYFNRAKVQEQLHVVKGEWSACSDWIGSSYVRANSTLQLFPMFKKAGLKILLFTGNVDAQVSYIETEYYIGQIGWSQTKAKYSVKNELGSLEGWVTQYEGLTLYVVNGAGHMVPQDKPGAALRMFQDFIKGKL